VRVVRTTPRCNVSCENCFRYCYSLNKQLSCFSWNGPLLWFCLILGVQSSSLFIRLAFIHNGMLLNRGKCCWNMTTKCTRLVPGTVLWVCTYRYEHVWALRLIARAVHSFHSSKATLFYLWGRWARISAEFSSSRMLSVCCDLRPVHRDCCPWFGKRFDDVVRIFKHTVITSQTE